MSSIEFERNLNFGFIKKGEEVIADLKFYNKGKLPCKIEMVLEGLPI